MSKIGKNGCNPELNTLYDQNSTFKELMIQNQKLYDQKHQQSYYSDLSKVNIKFLQTTEHFVDINNTDGSKIYCEKKQIIYLYSLFQPQSPAQMHKLYLYFIKSFPEPNEPYQIIYVNSSQSGKGKCWASFKSTILEQLPLKYLLFLEKIVLVRPSLLDKASSMIQFGVQNKFFKDKIERYDSLKGYFDVVGIKFSEMKKRLPTEVIQQETGQTYIKPIFSSLICNLNLNRISIQPVEQSLGGTQLKQTKPKDKKKKKGLENYATGEQGIPLALELLIFYFTQIPVRCETEGIFRKCTSIDDELEFIKALEEENYEILTKIQNSIAVGSVLKRFLGNLDPPIVPYKNYQKLIDNHSLDSIIAQIHSFPIVNFMVLMHLLKFLRTFIIPNSKKNLMTAENVAICFAPCLMKSKEITPKQILLATISVQITKMMITHFDEIFGNSHQQKRISIKTYRIFRRNSKMKESLNQLQIPKQVQLKHSNTSNNSNEQPVECLEDFLKPVNVILEGQEALSEKQSQKSNEGELKQKQGSNVYSVKIIKIQKPKSDIEGDQEQNIDNSGMKKHKSYKNLPTLKQEQIKLEQNTRKSDCDKNQIAEEQISNIPTSEQVIRLNKLRLNRSKINNK